MALTVKQLLDGEKENHVLPFFWQHGEDEMTLRKYMEVISQSGCGAVCVESRPHPDFLGAKWWSDMNVILDEARKRGMKVWILDDSHFPTGFANGAVRKAETKLRRQSIYCYSKTVKQGKKVFTCSFKRIAKKIPSSFMGNIMKKQVERDHFDDDKVIGVTVMTKNSGSPVKAQWKLDGDRLIVRLPEKTAKVQVLFLTRNAGIHNTYINMLDRESCRILIDTVYEPHWKYFKEDFGKTIAGFFSDEPEIGNAYYFCNDVKMGGDFDFPWSRELEERMPEVLGEGWMEKLPLLWENDADKKITAKVRFAYMDQVTRLVEECFSKQIGKWCEEHGVEYIGHVIEDGNAHARTGNSLGHYFRGLSGQHMAGIDNIGGQVIPQKEDAPAEGIFKIIGGRDGEFYHYGLGCLGASYGAIDPVKKGRAMCEIFGNYGWSEGPRLEKYLADHFMSAGINYFVPHAFSPAKYPDKDCPPHFYANGHNPQYRHFGKVVDYMNRICSLISDGKAAADIAVLYHGEAEWTGESMYFQKAARILAEKQVCFHIVPADIFTERARYDVEISDGLYVNGNRYLTLIVPYSEYIRKDFADCLKLLNKEGCEVIFIDSRPSGICEGGKLPDSIENCRVLPLEQLKREITGEVLLQPESWRIRYYHYKGAEDVYYFVNEDDHFYNGHVLLKGNLDLYQYDAWENKIYKIFYRQKEEGTEVELSLKPGESCLLICGTQQDVECRIRPEGNRIPLDSGWKMSVCRAIEYPEFGKALTINEFKDYGKINKKFSGFIAYEKTIVRNEIAENITKSYRFILEITDAGEDVEVFVNGKSAGIQVLPPFYYDITNLLIKGENKLRIEVATTLERERGVNKKNQEPTGITGDVNLYKL